MTQDLPPPILVQDVRGMQRLVEALARTSEIAFDTEANSFFNFRERVCLIQVTAGEIDYLVDPLSGVDVSALGQVLADPHKTKVFHDGEYDVLILKRDFDFDFAGLFDTRIAAAALGEQNPGLASVLKARFGIELDKSLQRSNWSARPLSNEQIRYARLDTRFLIPLMHAQRKELADKQRSMIVEGECRRLEQLVPPELDFNPDEYARLKGARMLSGEEQSALRELFVLRNELASQADLPPFKVMNNQVLIDLARARPRSQRELSNVPGFSPRQARRLGQEVLTALQRAKELGPITRAPWLPSKDGTSDLDEHAFEVHERLKLWRTDRARREGLDASLVINRHVLLRLAQKRPQTRAELDAVEGLLPWQIQLFGEELVDALRAAEQELAQDGIPKGRRRAPRRGPQ